MFETIAPACRPNPAFQNFVYVLEIETRPKSRSKIDLSNIPKITS